MNYDLTAGFVLKRNEALDYLAKVAHDQTDMIISGELDSEGATEFLDDVAMMRKDIINHDDEYIKFVECPMAASNINIIPMTERENY